MVTYYIDDRVQELGNPAGWGETSVVKAREVKPRAWECTHDS